MEAGSGAARQNDPFHAAMVAYADRSGAVWPRRGRSCTYYSSVPATFADRPRQSALRRSTRSAWECRVHHVQRGNASGLATRSTRIAAAVIQELGGNTTGFAARQLTAGMASSADLILTMERGTGTMSWVIASKLRRTFTLREAAILIMEYGAHQLADLATLRCPSGRQGADRRSRSDWSGSDGIRSGGRPDRVVDSAGAGTVL